ncbi:formyltetrahydrofolate deformylase [Kocuria coralli]|uniref:Formyltetrahydrofolate deformylase n=1 Tax=Kocuria coralli TaxID=1461025 RepID=A0A5J5KXM8_9MICC|nr:formyltetrahydrofolate deformylase [Kocuria coralli]KAA9394404.1 formyltetrahydrofolate deformylase [Kocuria coralli]
MLTLDCPEKPGIVHAVSKVLLDHGCNIVELTQFDDRRIGHFFMRVRVAATTGEGLDEQALRADLTPVADQFGMRWELNRHGARRRVLVMVSKFGHCLNDLLFRSRTGELPVEIVAVVSNHLDHQRLVEWHGIPFFHLPVTPETKPEAEARLLELVERFEIDLVVLARYMQVLSDSLATRMAGRVINIHHSFLPSFKGAKPYHQAYERGVKTVGATAHYVNAELDEGPIIAQQVVAVDHTYGPEELVAAGRDTECKALSDAVKWHCEGRVILHGHRTVVLR